MAATRRARACVTSNRSFAAACDSIENMDGSGFEISSPYPMPATHDNALIVVTGAGGFIGAALTARLRETKRRVRGIVRAFKLLQTPSADLQVISDLASANDEALTHAFAGARAV